MEEIKNITEKQIQQWKKQHGDVFVYSADGLKCYLKRPDRKVIAYANEIADGSVVKYKEALIENCFLGGDEAIKTEDKYFLGLSNKITDLVEIVDGELLKL